MASLMSNKLAQLAVLILTAVFVSGGDALIRAGLRGRGLWCIALGFGILGPYGLVLNQVAVDFSELLAGYVALLAIASVLFGMLSFKQAIPLSTWPGLGMVLSGNAIIVRS